VGGLLLLDPSGAPEGTLTLDGLREVLEPRLHLAPMLRQRLVTVPLGLARPYWVDDPDFDIEFHLREIALPQPGDDAHLSEQIGRIHARPLDRARPLWEMYLIHGVQGGRQALYSKVHHAAIDGVSGAEILAVIVDTTVEPRIEEPPEEYWDPAPLPSPVELFQRGVEAAVKQPAETLRTLPRALPYIAELPFVSLLPGAKTAGQIAGSLASMAVGGGSEGQVVNRRTLVAPSTPINARITAHRRFAFGSVDLEDVKSVKNGFALTVNDVVMTLCAGALRRWLLDHDGLPEEPLVVAVPVSIRTADHQGDGNQVSMMLAELPTHLEGPAQRLAAVQASMTAAKEQFQALPTTILQDVTTVIPTLWASLAARAVFRVVSAGAPSFNLFVSNVPGPQMPLYVGGARILGIYPASAITDLTGALSITVFSYDGSLDIGLIACRELVPDVWRLVDYLREALDELLELVASDVGD
nr:wax ester/triacylglycerol synthase family O-acyltransferase [Nocardioidaceae bacterium]